MIIEVNGKKYELQHPGNRAWIKLQGELVNAVTKTLDMEKFFDYCFEHIVFPNEGEKLTLDNADPIEFEEVWSAILLPFCRRKLEANYTYPARSEPIKEVKKENVPAVKAGG